MSWECECAETPKGREHMPGRFKVCPNCGRAREHIELLQNVENLVAVFGRGEADGDTLPRYFEYFRKHIEAYRGEPAEDSQYDEYAEQLKRDFVIVRSASGFPWPIDLKTEKEPNVGPEDFPGTDAGSQYDETPSAETIRREVNEATAARRESETIDGDGLAALLAVAVDRNLAPGTAVLKSGEAEVRIENLSDGEVPRDTLDEREKQLLHTIAKTLDKRVPRLYSVNGVWTVVYAYRAHGTDDEWRTRTIEADRLLDALRRAALSARADHKSWVGP